MNATGAKIENKLKQKLHKREINSIMNIAVGSGRGNARALSGPGPTKYGSVTESPERTGESARPSVIIQCGIEMRLMFHYICVYAMARKENRVNTNLNVAVG